MRIGIDIDDTVGTFSDELLILALEYDKTLRNTGIVDHNKYITKGMFDWSKEETETFGKTNFEIASLRMKPKPGVIEYLNKLKSEGNEIIFISKRSKTYYSDPYKISYEWLTNNNIPFDKLYVGVTDKVEICLKDNIEKFVDDIPTICLNVQMAGINSYLFSSYYNRNSNIPSVKRINNWEQFYNIVKGEQNGQVKSNIRHRYGKRN